MARSLLGSRVLLAVVAVLALAWLGIMERDRHLLSRGAYLTSGDAGPGHQAEAEAALKGARLLSPDEEPDLVRSLLYAATDRRREALALALAAARSEPENIAAWVRVRQISTDFDAHAGRLALAAMTRLDPIDARGH